MARKDGKRERQHYVPQLILGRFSFPGRGKVPQIYAFDKHQEKAFQTGIDNVLAEGRFYDFHDATDASLEPILSDLESRVTPLLDSLITKQDLKVLSEEDRSWIAIFVAAQHLRTKGFRERQRDLDQQMLQKLQEIGPVADNLISQLTMSEQGRKLFSLEFFGENLAEFSQIILLKDWHLYSTSTEDPFWIGDNPVTLYNHVDHSPYGNLGLMVQGIEIYIPLTPTLMLGMHCPSIMQDFRSNLAWARDSYSRSQGYNVLATPTPPPFDKEGIKTLQRSIETLSEIVSCFEQGIPLLCKAENIEFYNSLQARWADRYIVSRKNDFSLVKKMLKERPETKAGKRYNFG